MKAEAMPPPFFAAILCIAALARRILKEMLAGVFDGKSSGY